MSKYLRNNGLVSESEYKGLTLKEAIDWATNGGFTWRIVEEDGEAKLLDMSVKSDRINFRVRNGFITGAFPG